MKRKLHAIQEDDMDFCDLNMLIVGLGRKGRESLVIVNEVPRHFDTLEYNFSKTSKAYVSGSENEFRTASRHLARQTMEMGFGRKRHGNWT